MPNWRVTSMNIGVRRFAFEKKEGSVKGPPPFQRLRDHFFAIHFKPTETTKLTTAPTVARTIVFVTSPDCIEAMSERSVAPAAQSRYLWEFLRVRSIV